jgi:hypothetical protein
MKMNRNFDEFTDFESLELEVPTFCVVTGCVSARSDRRYIDYEPFDVFEGPKELSLKIPRVEDNRRGVPLLRLRGYPASLLQ